MTYLEYSEMVQDSSVDVPVWGKVSRTKTIAAAGLFASLAILFTALSQFVGLNFPIIPYLQFDFGEVAILLAFFAFGPVPAVASAFVEFVTLMALGQNVPIGPVFKLLAILSTLVGLWFGITIVRKTIRLARRSLILSVSLVLGLGFRAVVMTVANYYLIVNVYTISGIVGFVSASFNLIGISLTSSNALALILSFTAIFNCLQLILVFVISYLFFRLPQLRNILRANRIAWFESVGTRPHPQK